MRAIQVYVLTFLFCFAGNQALFGQQNIGFQMREGTKEVKIPFEEYSNLIVIPITINGFLTLKFILDTGAESAILTEKTFGDLMGLNYVRDITIQGPGIVDSLSASVATGIHMSLPGGIYGDGLNMLVLKEDYLELNKNLGEEIYGIIGHDIFSRFVISIDYEENILILERPDKFKPPRFAKKIPITVSGAKPFIQSTVRQENRSDAVNLMVDTGASHALLLDVKNTDNIRIPSTLLASNLGQGLGGDIPGFIGRMNGFTVNNFEFEEVLVSIPIDGTYVKAIKRGSRHGTIGGDLLTRFYVTFDYQGEAIYLTKNGNYNTPFEHDMSGVSISVEGPRLDSLMISEVRRNSPAYYAGARKGDMILRVNEYNFMTSSVSDFHTILRKRPGKKIRLIVLRDGEKKRFVFRLKRFI